MSPDGLGHGAARRAPSKFYSGEATFRASDRSYTLGVLEDVKRDVGVVQEASFPQLQQR